MYRTYHGALSHDEEIGQVVEAVSFDDTLGEIGEVVEGSLSEDQVIPVSSMDMYEVIADFERRTQVHQIARVDTKYKIVDRKVKPVATPLPEGSWARMKDRWGWLPTNGGRRLVQKNARKARQGLRIHTGRDRVHRPDHRQTDGKLYCTARTVEPQANPSTEGSHTDVDGAP